jgi:uncharacterized C2H2 Zn-finger protein
MPSNKEKVASYLEDDEFLALKQLCKEKGYTNSEAVKHLIRNYLIEDDDEAGGKTDLLKERLERLERSFDNAITLMFRAEALAREVNKATGKLEDELEKLKKTVRGEYLNELDDEQIAAITGQSVWKVKLWRYGIQKPRGKKIKKSLEPYIISEGKWKKNPI